jgi:methyltransferase-like protein/ubiquinone/menaquinone biosynthesis C-methylase UbiE
MTVARLFGMNPTSTERCRVLELGCASGGNLIPMAVTLPESEFVGIDLSAQQVAEGKAMLEKLGMKNVRLQHCSIMDVNEEFGQFDYIVTHGVFSWVPPEVQEKILRISKERLTPTGVAYVSYNTFPGWHMRGMIRDMMLYHTARFQDSNMKVTQARALIDFLVQSTPNEKSPYALWLKEELELVKKSENYYIFHEHLEGVNKPLYFHEFVEWAGKHGLQYLGEAEFHSMLGTNIPPKANETLRKLFPDGVTFEQYLDFVRNRMFRQTLMVHSGITLKRNVGGDRIFDLLVASGASPVEPQGDLSSTDRMEFKTAGGIGFGSTNPLVKATLITLNERWPQPVPFEDLFQAANSRIGDGVPGGEHQTEQKKASLGTDLLRLYAWGAIELHSCPPHFVTSPSECPQVSPLARVQAQDGLFVTNLRQEGIKLDETLRQIVMLLDGSRNREGIFEGVNHLIKGGVLKLQRDGVPIETEMVRPQVEQLLSNTIQKLAKLALLTA